MAGKDGIRCYHLSSSKLARTLGENRARVSQVLSLLTLPRKLQEAVLALGDPLTLPSITERQLRQLLVLSRKAQTRAALALAARYQPETPMEGSEIVQMIE